MTNISKTILIYDQCGTEPIKFAILDGDYTHLDGVYINSVHDDDNEQELSKLIYSDDGVQKLNWFDKFPIEQSAGYAVIVVGFLP